MTVNLLAFSGSLRAGSYNQRLLGIAVAAAREAGAQVTEIKLADFPLPAFDQQIEETAFPESAHALKELFVGHSGFLIASPEYNGSVSGVLKNAIDWVSRPTHGEVPIALSAFRYKVAGVMSASITQFGGLRGLMHLRQILGTVQTLVVPEQATVPFAEKAFNGDELIDPVAAQFVPRIVRRVIQLAGPASVRTA
jgi:NAD(P)H-dependent FMN reductase